MAIDGAHLKLLVCPKCKGELAYDDQKPELTCAKCKLAYRFEGDIPIMLIDEARPL